MLITICYSVLTWLQSRQRSEITAWFEEYLLKGDASSCSLVFIRDEVVPTLTGGPPAAEQTERPSSASSFYYSPPNNANTTSDSVYSSVWSMESSRCSSAFSTPRHQPTTPVDPYNFISTTTTPSKGFGNNVVTQLKRSTSFESSANSALVSPLCYNCICISSRRCLWQAEGNRVLVISPRQIVELHDWTSFKPSSGSSGSGGHSEKGTVTLSTVQVEGFRILLEAEPGQVKRHQYRKFSSLGSIVAWRWVEGELGLILGCTSTQLIQLMHSFRGGNIILEGGWRVYRITTICTEGSVGTGISAPSWLVENKNSENKEFLSLNLTPAELRRLSALNGNFFPSTQQNHFVYRNLVASGGGGGGGVFVTPPSGLTSTSTTGIFERVSNLSNHPASKQQIGTIAESEEEPKNCSLSVGGGGGSKQLLNWYERSPRKRSVANLSTFEKPSITQRRRSFCPGILLSSGGGAKKSSSLVSLLFKNQSISVDEEIEEDELVAPLLNHPSGRVVSSKSHESLSSLTSAKSAVGVGTPPSSGLHLLSPNSASANTLNVISGSGQRCLSSSTSPGRMIKKSPLKRMGKPPNILILCDDANKREEIGKIFKNMLANDRYAVYDIRWDQLEVGGWSEQTALLVLAGNIPEDADPRGEGVRSLLLQFLGDGGRLFAWVCDSPPYGPSMSSEGESSKRPLEYGPTSSQKVSRPLTLAPSLWQNFPKILETSDSEGYSRPLTSSVWARVKESSGQGLVAVLQLDGGALGGKAIFSRIEFEKCSEDDGSLGLLSQLLSQLGIDCSTVKSPEYGVGYLLGDHMKVQDFLSSVPQTIQQSELTLEFTPRGEKGSDPSHLRLPIYSLQCPSNFSTLEYYNNLETKELGRLVIYTDTITSTTQVLAGQSLRHGLVVIARRQTCGRGRGKNIWLSPEGCAMFSLQLVVRMDSAVGRRLSLLQHLAALSVILAVPNHKELRISVKWPNDIYVGEQKIGGVLVESRLEGKQAVVNVGIGVNVSNAYPTVCLNSILFSDFQSSQTVDVVQAKQGSKPKQNKEYWTTEKLVARTLTHMEHLLESLEGQTGLEDFLQLYQDNWIHQSGPDDSGEYDDLSLVNVEVSEGIFTQCQISGIDEYGFLRVVDSCSGNMLSVRPDGNSFDIANRLIAIKD